MNWITKIIKAGEKIKSAIHKRASKEDIANSDWTSCCKGPILRLAPRRSSITLGASCRAYEARALRVNIIKYKK